MMPAESYSYLSSRLVKEVFQLGGRVTRPGAAGGGAAAAARSTARRRPGRRRADEARRNEVKTAATEPRLDLSRRAPAWRSRPRWRWPSGPRALQGAGRQRVFDFSVGEPDQPTPRPRLGRRRVAALDAAGRRYAPAAGIPELRAAVAQRYQQGLRSSLRARGGGDHGRRQAGPLPRSARPSSTAATRWSSRPAWPTFAEAVRLAGGRPVLVPRPGEGRLHASPPALIGEGDHARRPRP